MQVLQHLVIDILIVQKFQVSVEFVDNLVQHVVGVQ